MFASKHSEKYSRNKIQKCSKCFSFLLSDTFLFLFCFTWFHTPRRKLWWNSSCTIFKIVEVRFWMWITFCDAFVEHVMSFFASIEILLFGIMLKIIFVFAMYCNEVTEHTNVPWLTISQKHTIKKKIVCSCNCVKGKLTFVVVS